MELGVYIRDRGRNPNGWRRLDSDVQDVYVIGRPTERDCPDITLHDGHISQRHAVLIYESPGYWTITSIGRHGSTLVRRGTRKALTKGDAIAIEDDDTLEVWGRDFAITFNTDFDETIGHQSAIATAGDDDVDDLPWWWTLHQVYSKAGPVERFAILLVITVVAIAAIVRWL